MLYDPSKDKPVDAAGWILWNAADYIERHGWCQNKLETPAGRVCAMGAIFAVGRGNLYEMQVAVGRLTAHNDQYVAAWNDTEGRTKQEVVAALRMDADVKRKWVEALRSGKYQQGRYMLHRPDPDAYCCLGVLCQATGTILSYNALRPFGVSQELEDTFIELNDRKELTFPEIADYIEQNL